MLSLITVYCLCLQFHKTMTASFHSLLHSVPPYKHYTTETLIVKYNSAILVNMLYITLLFNHMKETKWPLVTRVMNGFTKCVKPFPMTCFCIRKVHSAANKLGKRSVHTMYIVLGQCKCSICVCTHICCIILCLSRSTVVLLS